MKKLIILIILVAFATVYSAYCESGADSMAVAQPESSGNLEWNNASPVEIDMSALEAEAMVEGPPKTITKTIILDNSASAADGSDDTRGEGSNGLADTAGDPKVVSKTIVVENSDSPIDVDGVRRGEGSNGAADSRVTPIDVDGDPLDYAPIDVDGDPVLDYAPIDVDGDR